MPGENSSAKEEQPVTILNSTFLGAAPFSPPPLPVAWIKHELSQKQLVKISNSAVVLYHAPAGSGKTTAMLQHLHEIAQKGVKTAWISIHEGFNHPPLFMQTLNRAMQLACDRPQNVIRQRNSDSPGFDTTAASKPFAIFIDKLEILTHPDSLLILQNLIENLPANGKMIIATRSLPNLQLCRMRAYGQLAEIGMNDLLLSPQEIRLLLHKLHGALPQEDVVTTLNSIIQGWPAGIHLVSHAITQDSRNAASLLNVASHATIDEFLHNEMFAHAPESIQHALVQTAILNKLSAPLCNHLLGNNHGDELLEYGLKNSLFLIPTDDQQTWFELHRVARDFLRRKSAALATDVVAELHTRAARWYWQNQHPNDAVHHALLSRDQQLITEFLAIHLPLAFNNCQFKRIAEWYALLPVAILDQQPEFTHHFAATLALSGYHQQALALLNASAARTSHEPVQLEQELGWCFTRILIHITSDTPFTASLLPQCTGMALPQQRRFLSFIQGAVYRHLGNFEKSREKLEECKAHHFEESRNTNLLCVAATDIEVASIELARGNLNFSKAIAERIIERVERPHNLSLVNISHLFSANILHEQNEIEASTRLLQDFVPRHISQLFPDHIILGLLTQSRNARLLGNQVYANDLLIEMAELGAKKSLPRVTASSWLELARVAIDDNHLDSAQEHLSRASKHMDWSKHKNCAPLGNETLDPNIITARLLIKESKPAEALALLDVLIAQPAIKQRSLRLLKLNVLKCIALCMTGNTKSSATLFYRTIACSAQNQLVRTFADEASPYLASLLDGAWAHSPANNHARAGHEQCKIFIAKIRNASGIFDQPSSASATEAATTTPLHCLTKSELRILKLLAQGLSNAEIAKQAHLSVATVNAHLRNIYSKLNTSNRIQTVTMARNAGLV